MKSLKTVSTEITIENLITMSSMKKTIIKFIAFTILALNLVMVCLEIRNVKIILDEQSPLGVELDLSDAQFALRQMDTTAHDETFVARP